MIISSRARSTNVVLLLGTLWCVLTIQPAKAQGPVRFESHQRQTNDWPNKGINVTALKIYDERSWLQRVEQEDRELQQFRFFNAGTIAAAIGSIQGLTSDTSQSSFSVAMQPTPEISTVTKSSIPTITAGSATPTPLPLQTTSIEETVKRAPVLSTPPSLPAVTSAFTPASPLGQSPFVLLAQQKALQDRVNNYRMLLERSTSDRVISTLVDGTPKTLSRRQAVIGFRIGLEPRADVKDAVAEVDIVITGTDYSKPVSIVAQMPRAESYNVVSTTKKATSFGLGALITPITLGFANGKASETQYLVEEKSVVALARSHPASQEYQPESDPRKKSVTLSWQFRPVLGRRYVEADTQDLFAALALPVDNVINSTFAGSVSVYTRWRRFDRKTGALKEVIPESSTVQILDPLAFESNATVEEALSPSIDTLTAEDIGDNMVRVQLTGNNFVMRSSIEGAGLPLTTTNGLLVTDEAHLQFHWPLARLLYANPVLVPAVGRSIDVVYKEVAAAPISSDFILSQASASPLPNGKALVELNLNPKEAGGNRPTLNLPIVAFGPVIYGPSSNVIVMEETPDNSLKLSLIVPDTLVKETGKVTVVDPFFSTGHRASKALKMTASFAPASISVLSRLPDEVVFALSGTGFTPETKVLDHSGTVGRDFPTSYISSNLVTFRISKSAVPLLVHVVVTNGVKSALVPLPPPSIPSLIRPIKLPLNFTGPYTIEGVNLQDVTSVVMASGQIIKIQSNTNTALNLEIPAELCNIAEERTINFVMKDGGVFPVTITVAK